MTNRCEDIRLRLDDWLDDALAAEEHARVEAHLAECPACRGFFERYESLHADLSRLAETANRMAAPRAVAPPDRRWFVPMRVAAAILLTVGITLGGLFAYKQKGEPRLARDDSPSPRTTQLADTDGEPRSARAEPAFHLDLNESDGRLAVQLETDNPRIHIVWLYGEPPPVQAPHEQDGRQRSRSGSVDPCLRYGGRQAVASHADVLACAIVKSDFTRSFPCCP